MPTNTPRDVPTGDETPLSDMLAAFLTAYHRRRGVRIATILSILVFLALTGALAATWGLLGVVVAVAGALAVIPLASVVSLLSKDHL